MAFRLSNRLVTGGGGVAVCPVAVTFIETQNISVSTMACCVKEIRPCIVQAAAKTFDFIAPDTEDFSDATEITFDVWNGGTSVLSYSLTGAEISTINDYTFRLTIGNTDSAALPAGRLHCEAWVTLAGGDRRAVGIGKFHVIDSKKHDA